MLRNTEAHLGNASIGSRETRKPTLSNLPVIYQGFVVQYGWFNYDIVLLDLKETEQGGAERGPLKPGSGFAREPFWARFTELRSQSLLQVDESNKVQAVGFDS